MNKLKQLQILIFCSLFCSCGGSNYLTSMSNQNSDEAIYQDVLTLADAKSWDSAISRLGDMSSDYRDRQDVSQTEAGVDAGKCGLDFLSFVTQVGSAGASGIFGTFMSGFTTTTVFPSYCQSAQTVIENRIGANAASRVTSLGSTAGNNVNTFMAVLGAAKIGTLLRSVADTDQNGVVDATFDACLSTSITDAQIAQVGTGFALLLTNISTIVASLSSATSTALTNLSTSCSSLVPNPCAITDPTDATWSNATVLMAFRSLIKSSTIGIQSCASPGNGGNPLPYPFNCCP